MILYDGGNRGRAESYRLFEGEKFESTMTSAQSEVEVIRGGCRVGDISARSAGSGAVEVARVFKRLAAR